MNISLIVAMAENRVIGRGNQLPWHISAALKRFKKLTTGHYILMGRKTFESIGRPLPKRKSVVISRNPDYRPEGVLVASSLKAALQLAEGEQEVFIIGGAGIFSEALAGEMTADRLYMTFVHAEIEGDVYLPGIDWSQWKPVEDEPGEPDEKVPFRYSFRCYERGPVGS